LPYRQSYFFLVAIVNKTPRDSLHIYLLTVHHPLVDVTLSGRCRGGQMVIAAIRLGRKKSYGEGMAVFSSHPDLAKYGRMIKSFLDGGLRDLSSAPIDLSECSAFSRKVLMAARSIPWGATVSYSRLAAMAGRPRAVRAAASVMRNNPFPLVVPCHRVVRSDGSIGGFMGKLKGREVRLKRELLKREINQK
jgi:methylated-DNA-[protein]-cysteine S-methyltransferase